MEQKNLCQKCKKNFTPEFDECVCKTCQNMCLICGKKAMFNTEIFWFGVRCKTHSEKGMINTWRPKQTEKIFRKRIEKIGGQIIGKYVNNSTKVECICKNGHECFVMPSKIQQGIGMCKTCAGRDFSDAEKKFHKNISAFGGIVIGKYMGREVPVKCICPFGHECLSVPGYVQQGKNMCNICCQIKRSSAREDFEKKIVEMGGKIVGKYVNNNTKIACICKNGHDCCPVPKCVRQGYSMCEICSGRSMALAEQNFYEKVEELGGKVVGKYSGKGCRVECICKNGHTCYPIPNNIQQGCGLCFTCANLSHEKEKKIVEFLREKNVKFFHNKIVPGTRYHPDIWVKNENFPCEIFVEIDEKQHRTYKHDMLRMKEIRKAIGKKCVFIRYNPDGFTTGKKRVKISHEERTKKLWEVLSDIFTGNNDASLSIYFLFFTSEKNQFVQTIFLNE